MSLAKAANCFVLAACLLVRGVAQDVQPPEADPVRRSRDARSGPTLPIS